MFTRADSEIQDRFNKAIVGLPQVRKEGFTALFEHVARVLSMGN